MSELEHDDLLTALIAARTQLVEKMEGARGQGYASLFKMYLEVQEQIKALTPQDIKDTPLDEFSQRLARKRADDSGGSDSATGS